MKRMLVLLLICLLPVAALADEHASEVESGETAEMTAPEESDAEVAADESTEVSAEEAVTEEIAAPEEQAETVEIGPVDDDAQIYVIKKGDTLWGISKRFIKDPDYWPSLWANNPFVTNPHLIYPGQKIKFHDGRIEIVPAAGEDEIEQTIDAQTDVQEPAEEYAAPLPEPVERLEVRIAGGEGFIAAEKLEPVGLLVDAVDDRYMMAYGDTVFLTFEEIGAVRTGDRFDVVRPVGRVVHPRNGDDLGEKISELGVVEVKAVSGDVATAEVVESEFEMQRGDLLLMHENPRKEIVLKKANARMEGVVADARKVNSTIADNDIIYVDLGAEDGLDRGNMLYIARERRATELAAADNLRLPDRLMGAAVVVDVAPKTATALVLKSVDAILRGDKVITQTN